jgi:hypothetical protein
MEKVFEVQKVTKKLITTERAIDAAIIEASELLADMLRARQDLKVSAKFADPAFAKVAEAISTLSAARSAMAASHAELYEAKLRLGVRTTMTGWEDTRQDLMLDAAAKRADLREVG